MPEFNRWFGDNGDQTRLLNHNLNSQSVVFEVGGYLGKFTNNLHNKFGCKIYVFEPVKDFCEKLQNRFENYENIFVHNFGLHGQNTELSMTIDSDNGENSTLFNRPIIQNAQSEKIILRKIDEVIEENDVDYIDLLNINIEGGEYDLLNYLTTTPIIYKIKNIQVQFHDFVDNASVRRNILHTKLYNTHQLTYNYEFVWENWRLRQSGN